MSPRRQHAVDRARSFLDAYGRDLERGARNGLDHYLGEASDEDAAVVSEIWNALHGAGGETARLPAGGMVHEALLRAKQLRDEPESLQSVVDRALQDRALEARGEPGTAAGDAIPGYELFEQIGRGGQGRVHRGRDRARDREVAIKILPPAASADDLLRLRREGAISARLDDPCICKAYDVGECERGAFVVMELVRGESLAQRIARASGGVPDLRPGGEGGSLPRAVFAFLGLVGRALARMHAAGVLHRDVKPGNIMVAEDGRPVILDLGLARADSDATLTLTGDFFGTVDYMAPELLGAGRVQHDERTEVWSLGVVLFECLTGRRPFAAATRAGIADAVRRAQLPVAGMRAMPRDVRAVVETALDPDPNRRYRDAAAFADDLERLARGEAVAARSAGPVVRGARLARRHPAVTAALVLLVALPLVWALEARAGERRATRYLSDALATVESMLVELASVDLDDMPRGAALRRKLLEEASRRYEQLAADELLGDEIEVQLARVELELARLASEEGRLEMVEARVASARRRIVGLDGDAGVSDLQSIATTADLRQATLLMARGEHQGARSLLESARVRLSTDGPGVDLDVISLDLQLAGALSRGGDLGAARATLEHVVARSDPSQPAGAAVAAVANLALVQLHRTSGDVAALHDAQLAARRAVIDALVQVPGDRHLLGALCLLELNDADVRLSIPDFEKHAASITRAETVLRELDALYPHWRLVDLLRWQFFARNVEGRAVQRNRTRLDEVLERVVADLDACGESLFDSRRAAVAACAMLQRIGASVERFGQSRPELDAYLSRLSKHVLGSAPISAAKALQAEADWDCITQLFDRGGLQTNVSGPANRPSAALARAISSGLRILGEKVLTKDHPEAALEHFETAYALMKGAAGQDPSTLTRRFLMFAASRRGATLLLLHRWEEGLDFLEEALPMFLADVQVRAASGLLRHWLSFGPGRNSELLVDEKLQASAEVRIRLARLLAEAVAFLDKDQRMNVGERGELREQHVQRVRELVALAVAAGYDVKARPEDRRLRRMLAGR